MHAGLKLQHVPNYLDKSELITGKHVVALSKGSS